MHAALQGVRGGPPADQEALEQLLVRLSHLMLEQPAIREIDINPLLVQPGHGERPLVALDARVVIQPLAGVSCVLPRPAIRPYPSAYVRPWQLRDGTPVTIRPIRPEDEPLLVAFHRTLSEQSVYQRYFHMMSLNHRSTHERLVRICFTDYDREMALVVDQRDPDGSHRLLAVGRLSRLHGGNDAEFTMLVSDAYQRQGLGGELLVQLLRIGRDEGIDRVSAQILQQNFAMQRLCRRLGFRLHQGADAVLAELELADWAAPERGGSTPCSTRCG